jgi:hypothetical protein
MIVRNGFRTRRIGGTLALAAAAFALLAPGTAGAGLLSTGTASSCDPNTSQAFEDWGDSSTYRLMPGGSFDSGAGWTLAGGAKVVSGNEPYALVPGTHSLLIPAGGTATSPTVCFSFGDLHSRFVVRSTGGSGKLEVDVQVKSLLGLLSILDGGTVSADGTWDPSPKVSALISNVGSLLTTKAISLRLHASGTGFQVDDVYLDPFRGT